MRIILKCIFTILICVVILGISLLLYVYNQSTSLTKQYQKEFATKLREKAEHSDIILLNELVEKDWDYVHIFPLYTTRDEKYQYVGYKYAKDIIFEMPRADAISMVFMKDNHAVYWVDHLPPSSYEFIHSYFGDWWYDPKIEDAAYEDNPCFILERNKNSYTKITLDVVCTPE